MRLLLQRYLASHFIGPFLGSTCFALVFLMVFQLFRITKWIVNKDIAWFAIFELIGHLFISFIPVAIPLSTLFATVYAMRKLSEDSELMVMRSLGLNKYKIVTPFLIIGIFISLIIFGLTSTIIPESKRAFKKGFNQITSKAVLADIKPGQFFTQIPGVSLFAKDVTNKGSLLSEIFIEKTSTKDGKRQLISAKTGELIKNKKGKWGVADIRLRLKEGTIIDYNLPDEVANKIYFNTYEFPIFQGSLNIHQDAGLGMKSNQELRLYMLMRKDIRRDYINDKDFIKLKIEYWSRYGTALSCIVFIFLGFSLGWVGNRRRNRNTAGLCFLILAGYYILYFSGISAAKNELLQPSTVSVLPSIICFLAAIKYFRQLDWAD